jgi:hypothetical protein
MSERRIRIAIVLLALAQALVLVLLPLRAGPRIPSGTEVVLAATESRMDLEKRPDQPPNELFLDFGFDEIRLPSGVEPGDDVYVQLRGADGSDRPRTFGRVASDPADLPDGATWIKLPVYGLEDGEVGAGPLEVWSSEDADRIARLREHLRSRDDAVVHVTVRLDNDGDPTIERVSEG